MSISREILKSSERVRRKRAITAFSYLALFLASVFALTNVIFHLEKLYIKKIYITGNRKVSDEVVFNITKEILSDRYYGLYPKSNILIYPKDLVVKSLSRHIPWIASVGVSGTAGSLLIQIEEKIPEYLWCNDLSKILPDRICYYLDKDGLAFDKAPVFSDHIYLEFYGGNKRGGYMGRYILSAQNLSSVLSIKRGVDKALSGKEHDFGRIYGINVHGNGDYDLLFENGGREWKIIFNPNTDVLKKLEAVLSSPFFGKELESKKDALLYIDLRFGKKVFYKFEGSGDNAGE